MADELKTSFLGAFQASLSVLLVIFYGVLAGQFGILKSTTSTQVSTLCVRLFLPALLLTNIGSQLHADTAIRYVPILVWALFYEVTSMSLGYTLTRVFNLPSWMTPAMTFNNATALPLLLVQSLSTTGVLESLLMSDADSVSDAVLRAKSYFLVNAMINDSFTFAIGPRLLDGEEAPPKNEANVGQDEADGPSQHAHEPENGLTEQNQSESGPNAEAANEETSLLPNFVVWGEHATYRISSEQGRKGWSHLPQWTQEILGFFSGFLNAPVFGALTGAIIGLAPPLHKAFFGDPLEGGIFTAWLTDSVKNIGELFPALNIVVVGVKLSGSMRKMKRGEDSGAVPWLPMIIVLTVRFVMWPAISISLIYLLASRTSLLDADPMLWFAMMLMPTGPTAMKLTALADVTGSSESEKMSIAKFLSIAYAVSPIICFTIIGAIKACHAAMGDA